MFWDSVSSFYDIFETALNNRVYNGTGKRVAEEIESDDIVLECACGTGAISKYIAQKCKLLIATDRSQKMLKQTDKKCRIYGNVRLKYADIMSLKCMDNRFDKVVAGNVIHLLDEPEAALRELYRVCKVGGKVIIPTYINNTGNMLRTSAKFLSAIGVEFKSEFTVDSYKEFFCNAGYKNVKFDIVEGNVPCAIAVIKKE